MKLRKRNEGWRRMVYGTRLGARCRVPVVPGAWARSAPLFAAARPDAPSAPSPLHNHDPKRGRLSDLAYYRSLDASAGEALKGGVG